MILNDSILTANMMKSLPAKIELFTVLLIVKKGHLCDQNRADVTSLHLKK